ncbi:MAG: glycosyltransferase family 39 protein [Oligoflexia bacterium]|nr:glycosyltransferase family 39 protein [Oligoflexia bacterium]
MLKKEDKKSLKISYTLVFLTAIILLYQHLWVRGFFHDGYLYAAIGKNALLYGNWIVPYVSDINYPLYNQHPPLLFILEGIFFKIFGFNYVSARFFSVSWAFASIVLLTYFVGQSGNRVFAFYSGLIFALLPPLFKKARSPGLDITLMALILFSIFFYYQAYQAYQANQACKFSSFKRNREKWKWFFYWILAGIFFALCLWEKGPPALVVPMTVVLHLLLTGKLSILKKIMPWVSLLLGLALFSLWPALLYLQGHEIIFWDYVNNQLFPTIVQGRGQKEFMLMLYPYYFFENMGPWSILGIFGIVFIIRDFLFKWIKEIKEIKEIKGKNIFKRHHNVASGKENEKFKNITLLFVSLFLVVVGAFSLVRWKYSNYIVPSFPALAVLAAYPLTKLHDRFHRGFIFVYKRLLIVLTLSLLVFPLTTSITRDREIFKIVDVLENSSIYSAEYFSNIDVSQRETARKVEKKLINWKIVNGIYPYYSLVNFASWEGYGEVTDLIMPEMEAYIEKCRHQKNMNAEKAVVLIDRDIYKFLNYKYGDDLNKAYIKLLDFREKNMVALVTTTALSK